MLQTPENLIVEPGIDPVDDVQAVVGKLAADLVAWTDSHKEIGGETVRAFGFCDGDKFLIYMGERRYLHVGEEYLKAALVELFGDPIKNLEGEGLKEVALSDRGIVLCRNEIDQHPYWKMKNIPDFYRKGSK